jgi:hypothetical protein
MILESAHLESWNLEFEVPLRTHGGTPETRKLGIWKLQRSNISWRVCTLGNMESGIWVSVLQGCHPPHSGCTAHPSPGPPRPGRPWVNRFS